MTKKQAKESLLQTVKKRILPTFLISCTLPILVCILIPFEVFANNINEFMFAWKDFLPAGMLFALLFTVAICLALIFLPKKAYRITCAVVIGLAFMFFFQSMILNLGMNSLAGDNLTEAGPSVWKDVLNAVIWVVVIAGAVVLALIKDRLGIISALSILLCGIIIFSQAIGPIFLCVSDGTVFKSKEDRIVATQGAKAPMVLTTKGLTEISENRNVFVFCVDRFDQKYADQGYTKIPEIYNILDGFTAFDDNIALYAHTFPGIANLLTAKRYDCKDSRSKFLNEVYKDNNTLDVLADNGYKVNLFTQPFYAFTDASFLPEYVANASEAKNFSVEQKGLLSLNMMQIALYRCFPTALKPLVGNINSATCNNFVYSDGVNGYEQYSTDIKEVYTSIANAEFTKINDNLFTFIHVEGCHGVDYDLNWNKATSAQKKNIMISLENSFKIIGKYIDEMKDAGVYDNATIVITGDHGALKDDVSALSSSMMTAMFIKPSGSSGSSLAHSSAQVSHDNMWPAIMKSEGIIGDFGRSAFDVLETENVVRNLYLHTYINPMTEYVYSIEGVGKDFSNWTITKTTKYNKFVMD